MLIDNKQRCLSRDFKFMSQLIYLTLKTKIKFFKNDVYENSKRLNLNFGHTFAHAIEMSVKTKNDDIKSLKDLNVSELLILIPLGTAVIVFGFYPGPLIDTMQISVNNLISNYQSDLVYHLISSK